MALGLVPRSARALADQINSYYRVFRGIDPESVAVRLPTDGSFEVRHSATAVPVLLVDDDGIDGATIKTATITSDKLTGLSGVPAGSITTAEILDLTIVAGDIANATITAAKIASGQMPMLLAQQVVASPVASITFGSISSAYKHLELRIYGRSSAAVMSEAVGVRLNGDATAGNYWAQQVAASGSSVSASEPTGVTYATCGIVPGASAPNTSWFGTTTVKIAGYTSGTLYKPLTGESYANTDTGLGAEVVRLHGAVWAVSTAVTSLVVLPASGNWVAGTQISLYGYP